MAVSTQPFNLLGTYVRLDVEYRATRIEVTETFWSEVMAGKRSDLDEGWLVATFPYISDWTTSEMHPTGDEIVYLLSGEIDLVFQHDDSERVIPLHKGTAIVVPRGTWHTARVRTAGEALHITPGAGTQHRPKAD